jgi:hypothetical protein
MSKRPLDHADIVSRFYELFDMVAKDKCGPYRYAPAWIGLDSDDRRLSLNSSEDYYRMDNVRLSLSSSFSLYFFDRNDPESYIRVNNVLRELKKKLYPSLEDIENLFDECEKTGVGTDPTAKEHIIKYYKDVLRDIDPTQPYIKGTYVLFDSEMFESEMGPPIKQATLTQVFRKTILGLLGLGYPRYYNMFIPLMNTAGSCNAVGSLYITIGDAFTTEQRKTMTEIDLARLDEDWDERIRQTKIRESKTPWLAHNLTPELYERRRKLAQEDWVYGGRRMLGVEIDVDKVGRLEDGAELDIEEFAKLASLVKDYSLSIRFSTTGRNPTHVMEHSTLEELAKLLNVG